ncbi:MAG: GAF domain-containing protein [Acidobacteriota bacterium]|nr:GAF domain-containing protein [Acidobacteriota bacterium]
MAANSRASIVKLFGCILFASLGSAQIRFLTLEQAASRTGADLGAAYQGEEVALVGQVSARALLAWDSLVLPIQDNTGYGLLLDGSVIQLDTLGPGDWIQVRGVVAAHAGLPRLSVRDLQKFQTLPPPAARPVVIPELNSDRYMGVLVTTEGVVTNSTKISSGDLLTIGEKPEAIDVFLPKARAREAADLSTFHRGDRVRVTGIGSQYCPNPPYSRGYQVLLSDLSGIALIGRTTSWSPGILLTAMLFIAGLLTTWWIRERRMSQQRRELRALNQLVEEVIAASSPVEIMNKLNTVVPSIWQGSQVQLYLYSRGSKLLESIPRPGQSAQITIRPEAPEGPTATGVALCLRNRSLLAVPDTKRSPFIPTNGDEDIPRSVMFVPMFAQNELLGVMELAYLKREHNFGPEQQAATQHLANQIATALRLQDQKSIREQLFRSERLAAGAQLIAGVAAELRHPLSSILEVTANLMQRGDTQHTSELEVIGSEADRASGIVGRLLSFGTIGQMEAEPVDLNGLLLGLLRFRAEERKRQGIEILPHILNQRLMVLGSQRQLEQAFLNLLVHAEQAAAEARDIAMSISTSLLGKRILVEISYHSQVGETRRSDPFSDTEAEGGILGLGLCRAIIQSHEGGIRLVRVTATQSRFEVELPVMESGHSRSGGPGLDLQAAQRQLTFVAVEPDVATQKQLVGLLGKRGHRVIPVSSGEEAAELAHRLKFDAAVCSTRLAGLNWVDFYERVRDRVDSFVLLTDGYDADLAKAFQGGEGYVLSKPLDAEHLSRILGAIEERDNRSEKSW